MDVESIGFRKRQNTCRLEGNRTTDSVAKPPDQGTQRSCFSVIAGLPTTAEA